MANGKKCRNNFLCKFDYVSMFADSDANAGAPENYFPTTKNLSATQKVFISRFTTIQSINFPITLFSSTAERRKEK